MLLNVNYLLFFDKLLLTNRIARIILCAMNTNEISPRNNPQMNRIRKVSGIFRTIFFAVAVLSVFGVLGPIIPIFFVKGSHAVFSKYKFITMAGAEITLGIWAWFCYRLFNLCSHGDLFTSKVVSYIRRVGYAYFLMALATFSGWMLLDYTGENATSTAYHPGWPFWLLNLASSLFPGFLIIFIAWVLDEGRKIQEEQELTV
jgi:hypothetical protein